MGSPTPISPHALKDESCDRARVSVLASLAWDLCASDLNRAADCASEAYHLALREDFTVGLAQSLKVQSHIHLMRNEHQAALATATQALTLFEQLEETREQTATLEQLGNIYRALSDYGTALSFYDQGIALARANNDQPSMASLLKNIGNVHTVLSDVKNALAYYQESLALLRTLNDERNQASVLNNMGTIYRRLGDYPKALECLQQSLAIKQAAHDDHGRANVLNNLGLIYENMGMYSKALECYQESLPILTRHGDTRSVAATRNNMGILYREIGGYTQALEQFLKSLEILRAVRDMHGEASTLNNIGAVYSASGDFINALEYHHRSLALLQHLDDRHGQTMVLTSIGWVQFKLRNYREALACLVQNLDVIHALGDPQTLADTLGDIGDVYFALADMPAALEYYERCHGHATHIGYCRRQIEALLGMGNVHMHHGAHEQAVTAYVEALGLAARMGSKELAAKAHLGLAAAYESAGSFDVAIKHLRLHLAAKEEVFSEESQRTLNKLKAIHEVENARHETEICRLRTVELATLANHLQDVVQEKNELLDIAAHDLKNPLTAISLTASLVEAHGASMARHDLENYMSDINRSAANMVEIIERLVLVNTLETGNTVLSCCAVDIGALAHEVVEAYAVRARAKQLTLQHALPSHPLLALSDRTATRIVLDNLISNAVKYSPPGRSIDIRVHSSAGVVRVEIADQGPGLTHDDQQRLFRKYARLSAKPTANEQSTGVGLSIVKSLVTRMNGRVWCESAIGQGATFIVELPSADTAAAPAAAQSTLVAPEP